MKLGNLGNNITELYKPQPPLTKQRHQTPAVHLGEVPTYLPICLPALPALATYLGRSNRPSDPAANIFLELQVCIASFRNLLLCNPNCSDSVRVTPSAHKQEVFLHSRYLSGDPGNDTSRLSSEPRVPPPCLFALVLSH